MIKYTDLWSEIKNKIEIINGGKKDKYEKDFMELKFNSDINLPLNKMLKHHMLKIAVRSVFEEYYKLNPQIFLDGCFYKL